MMIVSSQLKQRENKPNNRSLKKLTAVHLAPHRSQSSWPDLRHSSFPMQVVLRGPKDDVEKARKTLLELANEKQLSSMSAEVRAKPEHHKFLIGRHGANVQAIRDKTGARIIFPGEKDKDREIITILGTKEAVAAAKQELELRIKGLVSRRLEDNPLLRQIDEALLS